MSKLIIDYQYFGTVNFYKILFQFSNIEFEEYESYQKGSFRNRTPIPGANGVINFIGASPERARSESPVQGY